MNHQPELTLSPRQVPRNATITVRAEATHFPQPSYTITDESGRVIRKGSISNRISEFKLSMVGLATGAYHFTMGQVRQRFTIML